MIVLADVEANGLHPTEIHCVCLHILDTGMDLTYTDMEAFSIWVNLQEKIQWVFHNGLGYDVDVINRLTKVHIDPKDVIDTLVCSKLFNYGKFRTHSLKEIGMYLGVYKGDYDGGWEVCTPEMVEYCEQDVKVLKAIFKMLLPSIKDKRFAKALRCEHDFAVICTGMGNTGFPFDKTEGARMLSEIEDEMSVLQEEFDKLLSGGRVEKRRVKLRHRKDGELMATSVRALTENPDTEIDGDEIVVYEPHVFNPGSPKQRVDALWKYGWKPVNKTVGHIKELRNARSR